MQRRQFLLAAAGSMLTPFSMASGPAVVSVPKQRENPGENVKPYAEIGDFADDRGRVFLFFSYGCGYCAQYAPAVVEWSKTFPSSMRLVRVPVITTDQASQSAALAYYIVRELAPHRSDEFDAMAYASSASSFTAGAFPDLVRRMQLPANQVQQAMDKAITKDRMARAVLLSKRYKVTATPHFGIAGRYATNVNFTNGNYALLMELLNGLVSQSINAA